MGRSECWQWVENGVSRGERRIKGSERGRETKGKREEACALFPGIASPPLLVLLSS